MIHMQLVARGRESLQALIRRAISDGRIKSFTVAQVKGGLRIRHKKHLGEIRLNRLNRTSGPLMATLVCKNRSKEWQLLEAFVGRLAYHFKAEVAGINIQLDRDE